MAESNTVLYILLFVVILHFIVGFVFLIKKLSPKPEDKEKQQESKFE